MTTVEVEKKEPFWRRHLVALLVGGLVVLLLVNIGGQILEDGDISEWLAEVPDQWRLCLDPAVHLVRRGYPDLPRRDDAERSLDDRGRWRPRARDDHAGRCRRRDPRRLVVVLDRAAGLGQDAAPPRQGAGKRQGSHRLGGHEPLARPPDRRRTLRPGDALRRQRIDGALRHSSTRVSSRGRS